MLLSITAPTPGFSSPFSSPSSSLGSCKLYANKTTNCDDGCGSCFNVGGREGVFCNGLNEKGDLQTGYFCPPDGANGDLTFACMDWSFGSTAMTAAEASFKAASGEDVYFGVGTFGTDNDTQHGLGACYRLNVKGVDKDIIAQSINTGHDVDGNQFDLQMGAGGAGEFNTCAGGDRSMYAGEVSAWGCTYGGVDNISACAGLPEYPRTPGPMQAAGDSLPKLCEASWHGKVRLSGAGLPAGECKYSPTILDVARVKCPDQLVNMTYFQRSDEPAGYAATPASPRPVGFPHDGTKECKSYDPQAGLAYCLTRMMDCRKPSGGFVDNVKAAVMVPGKRVVQTCTADGYTRIDVTCGCADCYC